MFIGEILINQSLRSGNYIIHTARVSVPKAYAFRFVSQTVRSLYPPLNLRRPSISSRRCTDLEQSSAAYHICFITSCLLLLLEDILLRTLLPVITVVREVTLSFMDTLIALIYLHTYLLTYLLIYLLHYNSDEAVKTVYLQM